MLEAQPRPEARICEFVRRDNRIEFRTEKGTLTLEPYAENIVRVVYTLSDEVQPPAGPGIAATPDHIEMSVQETESHFIARTSSLAIHIRKETSALSYFNADGTVLTKEPDRGGKTLVPFDSYKSVLDESAEVRKVETPDGIKEVIQASRKEFSKVLYQSKLELEWADGEALYGLGQHEEGVLNLRGSRQYLHQSNMKIAVPFLVSTRGYGVLLDTYAPVVFNDDAYGSYLFSEACSHLDFYFVQGNRLDTVIGGYRQLSGRATMLPKWAFGYIQSKERYENQREILDVVAEHRRRGIPLDCIVLDWQSWEGELWGQKTFDAERFPDPEGMIEELHRQGVRFMISVWPNMRAGSDNHREMENAGALFPHSETYNAFDPDARALYWRQANDGLFSRGVDAWWCDSSEPVAPEWNKDERPEPFHNMLEFHATAKELMDEEYTNAYSLYHSQTMYEGQRSVTDRKRVVNLTRSGYTGQQRFGTIVWSGDISATWKTLRTQIAAGLNLCASGLPYWTLDIGAFFVKKGAKWFWDGDYEAGNEDLGYRELYTRWLQFATFLPVFRSHGTDTSREIWRFGEPGEPFYDAIADCITLRYRLLPYIYSLAGMVTQRSYTILRLLAFDFCDDAEVYDISDQFMFGDALLVCPVTTPMYYEAGSKPLADAAKEREVYLPAGAGWYDFNSNTRHAGGQSIVASAPLETIPVFVKAGSIVPMAAVADHAGASSNTEIDLHVYPGADGSFTLYQDENDSYSYQSGDYATVELTWDDESRTLTLGPRQGSFAGMPETITFRVAVLGEVVKDIEYSGSKIEVGLTLQ